MSSDPYAQLCERLMVPGSERLAGIWKMLCDQSDAAILLAMPGTVDELAEKTGLPSEDVAQRLEQLFRRGVVFEKEKPEGTVYRPPRHLIQMHDASVQWPEAPPGFYKAWSEFMGTEYPPLLAMMMAAGFPSFMRVIPATTSIENLSDALDHENVASMIDQARELAIVRCPCRLSEQKCETGLETCIQFDRGADYNLKRGTGRKLTKEEAHNIVLESEEKGLVHTVENRAGIGNVLCNCCTCCCAIMGPYLKGDEYKGILAPSRFEAMVDLDACITDGLCEDVCPVKAIALDHDEDTVVVTPGECIGCGLCVSICTTGAITLKTSRPEDFIPS